MPRRSYSLGRRGEAAEETRRRIVEATFALHCERGIAATSMKQIAERAGVSIGAVYHHFPTYEDAIAACGAHTESTLPAPSAAIFAGLETPEERVARLAEELFGWFERLPVLERLRCDQDQVPMLRPVVEAEERHRIELTGDALRPLGLPDGDVRTAAALLDVAVYRGLKRAGFGTDEAARRVAGVILAWAASRGRK